MIRRSLLYIVNLLVLTTCIEPYSFNVDDSNERLVIESFITDVSYIESFDYPSDGRFFTTTLRYGQKINGFGESVTQAIVSIEASNGNEWFYTETSAGTYVLLDPDFKALKGIDYKLNVLLANNERFESDWARLESDEHKMGDISFVESENFETVYQRGEKIVKEVAGINLTVDIPEKANEESKFYLWQYDATWIYIAGRRSYRDPTYKCWVTGNSYLSDFTVGEDTKGGYTKELVFIDVETNERVFYDASFLIKEYIISEDYYNFLNELNKQQTEASNVFAPPPYDLKTNYHGINTENPVFGYFSVRDEEAKRMYFTAAELSFNVDTNAVIDACRSAIGPYPPDDPCDNCLFYNYGGEPSLSPPWWWHN